jgi:hypothetical protein
LKELPIFCYCCLQELKVQEQFLVHMNGILRNSKFLPTPSEENLPLTTVISFTNSDKSRVSTAK